MAKHCREVNTVPCVHMVDGTEALLCASKTEKPQKKYTLGKLPKLQIYFASNI